VVVDLLVVDVVHKYFLILILIFFSWSF